MDRLRQLGLGCTSDPARSSSSCGATQPAVSRAHSFRRWTKCPAGSHEPLAEPPWASLASLLPCIDHMGQGHPRSLAPSMPSALQPPLCTPTPTPSSARPGRGQGTRGAQAQCSPPGPGSPRLWPSPAGTGWERPAAVPSRAGPSSCLRNTRFSGSPLHLSPTPTLAPGRGLSSGPHGAAPPLPSHLGT